MLKYDVINARNYWNEIIVTLTTKIVSKILTSLNLL